MGAKEGSGTKGLGSKHGALPRRSAACKCSRPEPAQYPLHAHGPPPASPRRCVQGEGLRRWRVCKREAALTLNSSPGACESTRVPACVNSGEGAGLEAVRNCGSPVPELSASPSRRPQDLRSLKPFMILVTLFQEWAREGGASRGRAPPRPNKYGFPGSLWGRELGGEPRARSALRTQLAVGLSPEGGRANAQCRHSDSCSLPAAPVCVRDILIRDSVTVFKSQGRGSASPRTSCLYISPFTGEYPAPSAGISRQWLRDSGACSCQLGCEGSRQHGRRAVTLAGAGVNVKVAKVGVGEVVLRASRQRK